MKTTIKQQCYYIFIRSRKWVINSRRADLDGKSVTKLNDCHRLCSKHFEQNQFMNESRSSLVWNAVPTLFDVPNPPAQITIKRPLPNRFETPSNEPKEGTRFEDISANDPTGIAHIASAPESSHTHDFNSNMPAPNTPEKTALKRKIKLLNSKIYRLKNKKEKELNRKAKLDVLTNQLRDYLPESTVSFISTQLKVSGKHGSQLRWPLKDKMLCLSIFYQSRKAYKLLARIFKLPSISTLKRTLRKSNVYPGFTEKIFEALAVKVKSMSDHDRQCTLIFDEIALKSEVTYDASRDKLEGFEDFGSLGQSKYIANYATVFMIRGLKAKWKQALGYFLSSGPTPPETLRNLVFQCIEKLQHIGLDVRIVLCDQGPNNRCFMEKKIAISAEKPYFYINNVKIYAMYDPPHLMKSIRNNLMKQGFKLEEKDIKWNYIVEFFEFDRKLSIRMAPKLTDFHIKLRPFASMRVNLATQVLSHSVAAGITTLCELNKLDADAVHTATFIKFFDKLFNTFNSSGARTQQQLSHSLSATSGHLAFLDEAEA